MTLRGNIPALARPLRWMLAAAIAFVVMLCTHVGHAQQMPPRPVNIYVSPTQGLAFGAFFQGASGGGITVHHNGTRSTSGSVIAANLGFMYSPALFELDAEPGTVITVVSNGVATLTGSNGGTMQLTAGTPSTGSTFVATAVPPARNIITVGGTLTVGNSLSSPPGAYSGVFDLIFFQQ